MSSESCNVCVEVFNKSSHTKINCDFCQYSMCRKCCETYILSTTQKAHCMNCKKEWTLNLLVGKFTQKFINKDYKKHQEKCLLEREIALLPATQPIIEEIKFKKNIQTEMSNINKKIRELKKQLYVLNGKYYEKSKTEESRAFIKKCSNGECRGFLSTQWKCGLCDMWSCSECHEVKGMTKDAPHTCKTENLETAKLMKKECKSCPKCGVMIFKTEGCDQMWCTQCHTAFSWRTGRIETTIHNPHYYEWLRLNGNGNMERNPFDIQCGREIDNNFMRQTLNHFKLPVEFTDTCRSIMHMRIVNLPRFVNDRLRDNESLRVKYMTNEITEEKFKQLLQKREKAAAKKHEIANVLGMFVSCATDIMFRYLENVKSNKVGSFNKYKTEYENLKNYSNECLNSISKVYKCKKYTINQRNNLV